MGQRETETSELVHFLAESAGQLDHVTELIRDNGLELVAVIAIAQPRADGDLVLLFGGDAADKGAAA